MKFARFIVHHWVFGFWFFSTGLVLGFRFWVYWFSRSFLEWESVPKWVQKKGKGI